MIEAKTDIIVRYAETDKMGVVYHSNYFTWFEIGRVRLLDDIGHSYLKLENSGFRLPVLEATAKFIRPAFFDDRLVIHTTIREKPKVRMQIEYEIWREETILCTGVTRHAFVNEQGIPTRPPPLFIEQMGPYFR